MNTKIRETMDWIRNYQKKYPVNIIPIADDLGIHVYQASGEGFSGMIKKDKVNGGPSGYAIIVNRNDSAVRQRFTIAHEIAHFLLHKEAIGDGIVDNALYRSGLSSDKEVEANKLAAEILMPWHLLNVAMDDKIKTIKGLASTFQVSEGAMSIRLGIPS